MLKPNSQGGAAKWSHEQVEGVRAHRMHIYTQEITGADVLETLLCLSFEEEEEEGAVSVITDSGGWVGEGAGRGGDGILVVMCLLLWASEVCLENLIPKGRFESQRMGGAAPQAGGHPPTPVTET